MRARKLFNYSLQNMLIGILMKKGKGFRVFVACDAGGGGNGSCPTLKVSGGERVRIRDDYSSGIRVTRHLYASLFK
jgi:hypothetical protein